MSVPTSQEPGTFVIYLKGWSTGEPVLSIDQGTFDVLELWINVSIKSTGNIVFQMGDTTQYVLPGDCSEFDIDVTKHFTPGFSHLHHTRWPRREATGDIRRDLALRSLDGRS
ncbi:MAG: hypothetical protein CM1200mP21_05880 [Candidatus Poseidoniales archaeon]|nr:MAG: hypothetical protein CM1200mP21_05880 [Candidatus Poseidoniales archaeon]